MEPVNADAFVHAKENIVPLSQGRSAKVLASIYGDGSTAQSQQRDHGDDGQSERIELEKRIARLRVDDDDPLEPYDLLLKWYQQNYPSGHPSYADLLQKAAREFRKDPRYLDDLRFIKIWLQVAARASRPTDVFKYLSSNSIGQRASLFYVEYAAYLEASNMWKDAEDVFQIGLNRRAVPVDRLSAKYAEFKRRYAKHSDGGTDEASVKRPAYSGISRRCFGEKGEGDRESTVKLSSAQPDAPQLAQAAKREVFKDRGSVPEKSVLESVGPKGWAEIGSEALFRKENHVKATEWSGAVLEQLVNAPIEGKEKLAVFKDEVL
ncbi:Mitotic spindle checkpoint component mad3 [Irineochytrium annulatum]|nr:Mitotic spindle checkpoint component mad3 [Irineochytrium annulatum]